MEWALAILYAVGLLQWVAVLLFDPPTSARLLCLRYPRTAPFILGALAIVWPVPSIVSSWLLWVYAAARREPEGEDEDLPPSEN